MNNSPEHRPDDGRGNRKVFLDGKEIEGVVYANTKEGVVEVVCRDENGNIMLDENRTDIRTEFLRGKVEVVQV